MWYATFHSVDSSYNIYAYDDSGNRLTTSVLNAASAPKDLLKKAELRAMGFAPDGDFYVVNSKEDVSQILRFSGKENSDHSRDYKGIFTSNNSVDAIVHPFGYTVDPVSGNVFVSSQDTNVVTQVFGPFGTGSPGAAAPIAPVSKSTQKANFLDGTFIASAYTNLPAYSSKGLQGITPVAQPQGLDASPNDGSKVQNSVRGILYTDGRLYVADEPGNALKIYDGTNGNYQLLSATAVLRVFPGSLSAPMATSMSRIGRRKPFEDMHLQPFPLPHLAFLLTHNVTKRMGCRMNPSFYSTSVTALQVKNSRSSHSPSPQGSAMHPFELLWKGPDE
jgi:hypothetical protein